MSRQKSVAWGASPHDPLRLTYAKVRELKQLCHPDKHNNSQLSQHVFQWLNEASKELDNQIG